MAANIVGKVYSKTQVPREANVAGRHLSKMSKKFFYVKFKFVPKIGTQTTPITSALYHLYSKHHGGFNSPTNGHFAVMNLLGNQLIQCTSQREAIVEVPKDLVQPKQPELINEDPREKEIALNLARRAALGTFPTAAERILGLYDEEEPTWHAERPSVMNERPCDHEELAAGMSGARTAHWVSVKFAGRAEHVSALGGALLADRRCLRSRFCAQACRKFASIISLFCNLSIVMVFFAMFSAYSKATGLPFTATPKTTRTIYINATGTLGGDGSGSSATNPVDCSTQAKYDAFRQHVCPQGSDSPSTSLTIMYAPGTYKTNGSDFRLWWMCSNSGNIHQGAGMNNTTLQLVNANSINISTIFGSGGGAHQTQNFGLYDMTLDCNPAGNPKTGDCYESTAGDAPTGFPTGFIRTVDRGAWSGATAYAVNDKVTGSNGNLYICFAANTGVDPTTESPHLKWGKDARGRIGCINFGAAVNVTIQRVKMIGWGTFLPGLECYVCNIGGISQSSFQRVSNVLLDSCIFSNPASGNKDGCTVSDIINSVNLVCDANCVTSNCQFINCWSPTPGQPGDFLYQHCVAAPTVTGCTATNCDVFYFAELGFNEWPGQTIQIDNNNCTGVRSGFNILADNGTNAVTTGWWSFPNAIVSNNVFCQDDSTGGECNIFFVQFAGGNIRGQIGNITITGNTFKSSLTNPAWLGDRVAVGVSGASLLQVANITANNNVFINYLPANHYIFYSGVLSFSIGTNDISR